MNKIKKYTKKLRKKIDKKNIDVKETDVMELKKLRNKAKTITDSRIKNKCTYIKFVIRYRVVFKSNKKSLECRK